MSLKNTLTNEKLNKLYANPFALVSHAIEIAKFEVRKGGGMDSHLASDILEMIASGEDLGLDLSVPDEDEEEPEE